MHSISAISLRLDPENCEFQRDPTPALLSRAGAAGRDVAASTAASERGRGNNELMKFLQEQALEVWHACKN